MEVKKLKVTVEGVPFKIPFVLIDFYRVTNSKLGNYTITFGLVAGGELTLKVDDYEGTIRQLEKYYGR